MATPRIHEGVVVQGRTEDVKRRLLAVAGTDGYQLLGETPQGFGLRRKRIPLWAILGAVFFFPFGLLLLLARVEEIVTVAVERVHGGTHVTTVGRASVALQRAMQQVLGAFQVAGAPAPRWVAAGAEPPPAPPPPPPPPPPAAAAQDTPATPMPVASVSIGPPLPLPAAAMTGSPGGLAPGPPGGVRATIPHLFGPIGGPPGGFVPDPPPLAGLAGGGPPGGLGPLDLPQIPRLDPRPAPSA